jgi:hypothetical protein
MVEDTDVLIDFLEDRPPAAARIALELARGFILQLQDFELAGSRPLADACLVRCAWPARSSCFSTLLVRYAMITSTNRRLDSSLP